ncbi:glycosyl transferase [Sulfitobacter sp. SK012]|uniref:glycosyltransferase family 4 protein n=1 Tax=Sulfitobacter sp. SK012 TaxID=1389005 RepID=UPI000E0B66BE|nr:glycosyltransferase family 1 protein [Sulfitobacter sp. SK012]AXI44593.1 glycosyl transferase [Sulfitobacter sp. SK012]
MKKLMIDGVFFQLASSGIARVWVSVLTLWAQQNRFDMVLLDRGNAPEIDGVRTIPFPRWHAPEAAADSALLQQMCDHLGADAFVSTYYTSPVSTPMALMVYDMIPELFDFDMRIKDWREKEIAIAFAQSYLCISNSTRNDLIKLYPEISDALVAVEYCGVDVETFRPRDQTQVDAFRAAHSLDRPYFLFVGSRVQHKAYKNSDLFFDALGEMQSADFDVFCVGGETEIEARILDSLPNGVRASRVSLSDDDLSLAYAGAAALVYPSLYEGFGMPVIEAMASGCPVITTSRGSLAEAAGDAALLIDGTSVPEMVTALQGVLSPDTRATLREKGLAHAAKFEWQPMADKMAQQIDVAIRARDTKATTAFFAEWTRLRSLMADVDHI